MILSFLEVVVGMLSLFFNVMESSVALYLTLAHSPKR